MSREICNDKLLESTRLLSLNSCSSDNKLNNSETSDINIDRDVSVSWYGSVDDNVVPTVPLVSQKLSKKACKSNLEENNSPFNENLFSKCIVTPMNYEQDRCYNLYNIDLVLDAEKYTTFPSESKNSKSKQNSVVTIFSIWNTILGSSLLTMPWGILMAGLVPGILLILLMSGLCLYTAHKLLQVHKYHGGSERIEVIELSRAYLGPWTANVAKIFSISVLLGATIAYWILMSNFLYFSVNFIYDTMYGKSMQIVYNNASIISEVICPKENVDINSSSVISSSTFSNIGPTWDLFKTVPIFLAFIIFPLLNFNSATFFTKFNSLGTASIVYLIIFITIKSASWGINMSNETWETNLTLRSTFPALSGMLSLSFFIHNIIINIMESNKDQRKNGRDLTIAYILVTLTYAIIGITFYICFPLNKTCIEDNFLNNFQTSDELTMAARVVLLFQLMTVFPLIAYMLRTQLLAYVFKKLNSPKLYVIFINIIIVTICVLMSIFLPRIGTIIRYTGSVSGLIYIFTLPCLLYLIMIYKQGKLTTISVFFHACLPIIGLINFISQFIISEKS